MFVCVREFDYIVREGSGLAGDRYKEVSSNAFSQLRQYSEEFREADSFLRITSRKGKDAIQVRNHVGTILTKDGFQIEVIPKIQDEGQVDYSEEDTRRILLKMLRALRGASFKQASEAAIRTPRMPLLEIYISILLNLVAEVVRRGLRSNYVRVQAEASYLKGRLLVSRQLRKPHLHDKFCIDYNEYLTNRPINRIIKAALLRVYKITRSSSNKRDARELLFAFDDIPASTDIYNDLQRVQLDRTMREYDHVLSWCKLILAGMGPFSAKGNFETLSILYPMERLFEDYVSHCLRRQLAELFPDATHLKAGASQHSLVASHQCKPMFRLKPDILITKGKEPLHVIDAKWKLLNENARAKNYEISQMDMYQLFAYGRKYMEGQAERSLMLIYPKSPNFTKPLPPFHYDNATTLQVLPFDLEEGRLVGWDGSVPKLADESAA